MLPGAKHAVKTYQRIRDIAIRYERFFMPIMLVFGVALDVWQFRVLDLREKFIVSCIYVAAVVGSMLLTATERTKPQPVWRYFRVAAPLTQQFALGGLLSTALLFYWFSGTISVTWPLVAVVVVLMISNETLRHIFIRPTVQVGVFYFSLFSLFAIWFAHVFESLSWPVFLAGGMVSMVVMSALLALLVNVGGLQKERMTMWLTIVTIFSLMNVGYFLNVIPPIPLALREAKMAYHVTSDYDIVAPTENWWQALIPGERILVKPGNALYAYTAVYAPDGLSTTIVHVWQRYDEASRAWKSEHALSYVIIGGRADGYRGYSMVSSLAPGAWRVSVETTTGQVLGRLRFDVVRGE